jgi:hypothetical protein
VRVSDAELRDRLTFSAPAGLRQIGCLKIKSEKKPNREDER